MKTLILYDTINGFTKDCAQNISTRVNDSSVYEISSEEFRLEDYETILIGAPIYRSKINKNVIDFITEKMAKLLDKKLGMFCAGMNKQEFHLAVQNSLPVEFFYRAKIVHCGGKINFAQLSLLQKLTVKRRLGIKASVSLEKKEEMTKFIAWVNGDSKDKTK